MTYGNHGSRVANKGESHVMCKIFPRKEKCCWQTHETKLDHDSKRLWERGMDPVDSRGKYWNVPEPRKAKIHKKKWSLKFVTETDLMCCISQRVWYQRDQNTEIFACLFYCQTAFKRIRMEIEDIPWTWRNWFPISSLWGRKKNLLIIKLKPKRSLSIKNILFVVS